MGRIIDEQPGWLPRPKKTNVTIMSQLPERNTPAHFTPIERDNKSIVIFLTVCSQDRKTIFANDKFHQILIEAWKEYRGWSVGSYVIMPDHIHLFCTPTSREESLSMTLWIKKWKSYCSRNWKDRKEKQIWQNDYWDRQMRSFENYSSQSEYLFMNPLRKGLVDKLDDWQFRGVINHFHWHD